MKTTLNLISSKLPAAAPAISCWLSSNYTQSHSYLLLFHPFIRRKQSLSSTPMKYMQVMVMHPVYLIQMTL